MRGMKAKLVFLHGLESGPQGSKYQALQELDTEMIAPNCQGITDIAERLQIIQDSLEGVERMFIVGSSFGGLAALLGMLNSCASGVTVVNIDNGFGAGYAASQMNPLVQTQTAKSAK